MATVRIALLQDGSAPDRDAALQSTAGAIRAAAAAGAQIVCTKELFLSPYFCQTQDPAHFNLAETVPGPTTDFFRPLAAELGVVLILSLFEHRSPGLYHNTTAVLDADGGYLGRYRKMHIPQDPCFEEKFYFTPGDAGFRAWDTRYGRIGVIICWDQWFPEAARLTALDGALILFCPTAIGWLPGEKSGAGQRQRNAWIEVQRGHAVANACYYAAVNRTGTEGAIEFWGTSFVSDYTGEILARAGESGPEILVNDCDLDALEEHRRMWPFFRDRRVDAYGDLSLRFRDA
ncbi:MAG TPA: carbon-nitrogen hydrolase [Verrucomicrobiales bacterium]|nr:carbon-nitrogen hydrolase [Verrucomicrobiales bacterium]